MILIIKLPIGFRIPEEINSADNQYLNLITKEVRSYDLTSFFYLHQTIEFKAGSFPLFMNKLLFKNLFSRNEKNIFRIIGGFCITFFRSVLPE